MYAEEFSFSAQLNKICNKNKKRFLQLSSILYQSSTMSSN